MEKMKKYKFYGISDDLIRVDGSNEFDEVGVDNFDDMCATFKMTDPINRADSLYVHISYDINVPNIIDPIWSSMVFLEKEDGNLPDWKIWIEQAHEYAVAVCIECPERVVIERVGNYD